MSKLAQFNPEERMAARRSFFGTSACPNRVVLTPIKAVYDGLTELDVASQDRSFGAQPEDGWWYSNRPSPDLLVVRTPQSSAILDAVLALEKGTEILFVGYCGAFKRYPVGTVVEATHAFVHQSKGRSRIANGACNVAPLVSVVTTPCVTSSYTNSGELAKLAECADLEAAFVFEGGYAIGATSIRALFLVTDEIADKPFFKVGADATAPSALQELLACARQVLET